MMENDRLSYLQKQWGSIENISIPTNVSLKEN